MAEKKSVFERHPAPTIASLALLSVLATDVGFTQLYLWIAPRFVRPQPKFRVRSEIYHHGFEPLVSVDVERWGPWVSSYRINSLGFRDRAVRQVSLTTPKRRIVFIGDSFTEGVGVRYEETFVGLIDDALAPRSIEVLNAGVASYSPIMYYRRVRHLIEDLGLGFDELVVFIDIGDMEDEVTYKFDGRENVVSREKRRVEEARADRRHDKPFFARSREFEKLLERNTLLLRSLYAWADRAFSGIGRRAGLWTVDDRFYQEYGREGLRNGEEHMNQLLDLLRRNGILLTIAVYPWPEQIVLGDLESKQATFWRRWASEAGVDFIDYFPGFVDRARGREMVDRYYIFGDIHWNEAGHRRIAEGFLEHYARRQAAAR